MMSNETLVDTVKLVSSDGFEFIIARKCAMASGTIKNMLSSPGRSCHPLSLKVNSQNLFKMKSHLEISSNTLSVMNRAIILEKVCKYLYYKTRHANSMGDIPNFDIEPELSLELLMAADFLDC